MEDIYYKYLRKYESVVRKIGFRIPPIIYHYGAKNILCFNGDCFYYKNPWGVKKFKTKNRKKDLLSLLYFLADNKYIEW